MGSKAEALGVGRNFRAHLVQPCLVQHIIQLLSKWVETLVLPLSQKLFMLSSTQERLYNSRVCQLFLESCMMLEA